MKKFALIGLFLGLIVAGMAIYYIGIIKPDGDIAESEMLVMHEDSWYGTPEHYNILERLEFRTDFAIYTLLAGAFGFLVNLWPSIKKEKFAWIGAILSLFATIIGLAYGTHMFS